MSSYASRPTNDSPPLSGSFADSYRSAEAHLFTMQMLSSKQKKTNDRHFVKHTYSTLPKGIECSVCMEAYSASGLHEAKICPCGHTFCKSCLMQLPSPKMCPVCRVYIASKIDDLPRNYALIDIIMSSTPYQSSVVSAKFKKSDKSKKSLGKLKKAPTDIEVEEKQHEIAVLRIELLATNESRVNAMFRLKNFELEAVAARREIENYDLKIESIENQLEDICSIFDLH